MKLLDKCFSIINRKKFSKQEEKDIETFNTITALTVQNIYLHTTKLLHYAFCVNKFKLLEKPRPILKIVMDEKYNGKHLKFKSEVLNKEIDVYLEDQEIAEYYPVLTYLIGIYVPEIFKIFVIRSNVESIYDYGNIGNDKIYEVLRELEEYLKNVKYANYDI